MKVLAFREPRIHSTTVATYDSALDSQAPTHLQVIIIVKKISTQARPALWPLCNGSSTSQHEIKAHSIISHLGKPRQGFVISGIVKTHMM